MTRPTPGGSNLPTGESLRDRFARDHAEIDSIFQSLLSLLSRSGAPSQADVAARLFETFEARLERHIRWEEEALFPAVEAKRPELLSGPGRVMRRDHEELRKFRGFAAKHLRSRPLGADGIARAKESLERVLQLLASHDLKEENVYYPMAEELLSADEKSRVLEAIRQIS